MRCGSRRLANRRPPWPVAVPDRTAGAAGAAAFPARASGGGYGWNRCAAFGSGGLRGCGWRGNLQSASAASEREIEGCKLRRCFPRRYQQRRVHPADTVAGEAVAANEFEDLSRCSGVTPDQGMHEFLVAADRPPSISPPTTSGCTRAWPPVIQVCATKPSCSPRRNLSLTPVSTRTLNAGHRTDAGAAPRTTRAENRTPRSVSGAGRR